MTIFKVRQSFIPVVFHKNALKFSDFSFKKNSLVLFFKEETISNVMVIKLYNFSNSRIGYLYSRNTHLIEKVKNHK